MNLVNKENNYGCLVIARDLKTLKYQPKQINHGVQIKLLLALAFTLIPTFAKLLKNKRQMRNRGMDATIRLAALGTR